MSVHRNRIKTGRDDQGRFLSGTSGNPGGRPSGPSVRSRMLEALREATEDGVDKATALARSIVDGAIRGDTAKQRLALEYLEGKPTSRVSVQEGMPLPLARELTAYLVDRGVSEREAEEFASRIDMEVDLQHGT